MINIIYKIPTANDSEQHKDINNDNAIKHLESNKDSILDLAEKNYENLITVLTNNVIDSAIDDCSLSYRTLSLSWLSSVLPCQVNYKIIMMAQILLLFIIQRRKK